MILHSAFLLAGLVLLILGANWFIKGASTLAKRFNISDLMIGLTVVAFGTSAPELVVNTFASINDQQGIVMGNVIGSNNFNLLMTLGLAGLITPIIVQSNTVWKEIPLSLIAAAVLLFLCNDPFSDGQTVLSRVDGIILLCFFAAFMWYIVAQMRKGNSMTAQEKDQTSLWVMLIFIVVGMTGLLIGGRWVTSNAVEIARLLSMDEKVIGLTIVAAGTSLPELATTIVAAVKKNNDIAVGNIIGSNIFNIFFILAVSTVIRPIEYDSSYNVDLFLLIGATAFLFIAMFTGKKKKLDRWEAMILLIAYLIYILCLISSQI